MARPSGGNVRTLLADAWDKMSDEQRAKVEADAVEIWANILNSTRAQWSFCPDCGCKVQADFPDFVNQAKALQIFADQTYGETPKVISHQVDLSQVTLEMVRGMSMAQLGEIAHARIVDGEIVDIDDAEFDEIPEQPGLPPAA